MSEAWRCPTCKRGMPEATPDGIHCVECNNPDMAWIAWAQDIIASLRAVTLTSEEAQRAIATLVWMWGPEGSAHVPGVPSALAKLRRIAAGERSRSQDGRDA